MRRIGFAFAFILLAVLVSTTVGAVTIREFSLEDLAKESALVVIGSVTGIQYRADPKTKEVFTDVRLHLLDVVIGKGQLSYLANNILTLPFSGGMRPNGTLEVIVGMPALRLGQTYLLFLKGGEWTLNPISGWNQGVFRLVAFGEGPNTQMLVNLANEVLIGVQDQALVFKGASTASRGYKSPAPRPESGRKSDTETDLKKLQDSLKDSIYREDNVEALEKADERRVHSGLSAKLEGELRPTRKEHITRILNAEPIQLGEFVDLVRELRARVEKDIDPKIRKFRPKPKSLPVEIKGVPRNVQ